MGHADEQPAGTGPTHGHCSCCPRIAFWSSCLGPPSQKRSRKGEYPIGSVRRGPGRGDAALVPSTLLGLYQAEINTETLVPLLIMYLVSTPTFEDSVSIPISLTYETPRLGIFRTRTRPHSRRDRAGSTSGLCDWQRPPRLLPCCGRTVCFGEPACSPNPRRQLACLLWR